MVTAPKPPGRPPGHYAGRRRAPSADRTREREPWTDLEIGIVMRAVMIERLSVASIARIVNRPFDEVHHRLASANLLPRDAAQDAPPDHARRLPTGFVVDDTLRDAKGQVWHVRRHCCSDAT